MQVALPRALPELWFQLLLLTRMSYTNAYVRSTQDSCSVCKPTYATFTARASKISEEYVHKKAMTQESPKVAHAYGTGRIY